MRVIVLIEWGPMRWQKAVIEPGKTLRVGRHERADFVVPHDEQLSGVHFELAWDGARGTLTDLKSARGTSLNGQRISSSEVANGDWISAGETTFSIYFEGQVVPFVRDDPGPSEERKAAALAGLGAVKGRLYAVLDAARDERILPLLRACPEEVRSLYDGTDGEELSEVAPYLVRLSKDSWLLARLIDEGWGRGWGIYLTSRRPFLEVRRGLRRMLLLNTRESGEVYFFRFYDPQVLTLALSIARGREKQQLFGEAEAFFVEGGPGSDELRTFRQDSG